MKNLKDGWVFGMFASIDFGKDAIFEAAHTYNQAQIDWVKAGSALNKIREELA